MAMQLIFAALRATSGHSASKDLGGCDFDRRRAAPLEITFSLVHFASLVSCRFCPCLCVAAGLTGSQRGPSQLDLSYHHRPCMRTLQAHVSTFTLYSRTPNKAAPSGVPLTLISTAQGLFAGGSFGFITTLRTAISLGKLVNNSEALVVATL